MTYDVFSWTLNHDAVSKSANNCPFKNNIFPLATIMPASMWGDL